MFKLLVVQFEERNTFGIFTGTESEMSEEDLFFYSSREKHVTSYYIEVTVQLGWQTQVPYCVSFDWEAHFRVSVYVYLSEVGYKFESKKRRNKRESV